MEPKVKIVICWSVIALSLAHVAGIVIGERVAPRIERALGIKPIEASGSSQAQKGGIDFDRIYGDTLPMRSLPINKSALDEVKQGRLFQPRAQPQPCVPCQNRVVVQPSQPVTPLIIPSVPKPAGTAPAVQPITPAASVAPKVQPTQTETKNSIALFVGSDAKSRSIVEWFTSNPQLKELKDKSNYHVYTVDNAMYQTRYKQVIPPDFFPAVLYSDSRGGHIHATFGEWLPGASGDLVADFVKAEKLHQAVVTANIPLPPVSDYPLITAPGDFISDLIEAEKCPGGKCPNDRDRPLSPFARDPLRDQDSIASWFRHNQDQMSLALGVVLIVALGYVVLRRVR